MTIRNRLRPQKRPRWTTTISSCAEYAQRHSPYKDSWIDTWSVIQTSNATCAPSAAKDSTIPLIWSDTHERTLASVPTSAICARNRSRNAAPWSRIAWRSMACNINTHTKSDVQRWGIWFCFLIFKFEMGFLQNPPYSIGLSFLFYRPFLYIYKKKKLPSRKHTPNNSTNRHFCSFQMYVCEECGHTTSEPEVHYIHLKDNHPYSPALLKFYDKRHFKFTNSTFANNLLGQIPMPVHN